MALLPHRKLHARGGGKEGSVSTDVPEGRVDRAQGVKVHEQREFRGGQEPGHVGLEVHCISPSIRGAYLP